VPPQKAGNVALYKNITQIDARNGKDIISFKKISINEIQKYNYQEVASDRVKEGLSNVLVAGTQIAAVSALNPAGLFTATVSPQLLTQFANGTFSTMIHEGGHIAAHAGFQSISATVFAPIAIMQVLSMITGQYYMNGITKQLKSIDKKINLLIKFHHTEKIAELENAQALIQQLCDIQYPGIEHLSQLKIIETKVGAIYREYSRYLENSMDKIKEIDDTLQMSSQKSFDNLFALDDESAFSFNVYMVTTADEILHLIPIIELMLNVKMNTMDNSRNRQIEELYSKIANFTEKDFFANHEGKILLDKYYTLFIDKSESILENTWTHKHKKESAIKLQTMKKRKKDIKENILDSAETLNIKQKLVEQMTSPVEILYSINEEGKELVYVKQ
jgi:hypothetical protein